MKNSKIILTLGLVSSLFFSQFASASALNFKCKCENDDHMYDLITTHWSKVVISDDWSSIRYLPLLNIPYYDFTLICSEVNPTKTSDYFRCSNIIHIVPNYWKQELVFLKDKKDIKLMWIDTDLENGQTTLASSIPCEAET